MNYAYSRGGGLDLRGLVLDAHDGCQFGRGRDVTRMSPGEGFSRVAAAGSSDDGRFRSLVRQCQLVEASG
jgi:hypothetical protein